MLSIVNRTTLLVALTTFVVTGSALGLAQAQTTQTQSTTSEGQTARAREIVQWLQAAGLLSFSYRIEWPSRNSLQVQDVSKTVTASHPCIWTIESRANTVSEGYDGENQYFSNVNTNIISFQTGRVVVEIRSPCGIEGQHQTSCVSDMILRDHLGASAVLGTRLSETQLSDFVDAVAALNEICGPTTRPF
jgi:hypothetical protein